MSPRCGSFRPRRSALCEDRRSARGRADEAHTGRRLPATNEPLRRSMSGACAELRCFCLVSVSRPGLAFRVCCECPDCVFAAARIASLVQLNCVGVETDARHNPRNSCRSRLYIEFVPQPFRLKAQTHRLFCSAGSGCCKLVTHSVERRSFSALCCTGSREKIVVALLVAVWLDRCLAERGRAGVRTLSHI